MKQSVSESFRAEMVIHLGGMRDTVNYVERRKYWPAKSLFNTSHVKVEIVGETQACE